MGCGFSTSSATVRDPKGSEFQSNVESFAFNRLGEKVRKLEGITLKLRQIQIFSNAISFRTKSKFLIFSQHDFGNENQK